MKKLKYLLLTVLLVLKTNIVAQVVINEVLYDPSGGDTGNEWIELKNIGVVGVPLDDYCLYASGDHYVFPSFTLSAGAFVVVHWNLVGTNTATDLYTGTTSWDNMGNTAESVAFFNTHSSHTSGTILDYMEYGDSDNPFDGEAESAGIWTAGDFAPDVAAGHSLEFDGSGDLGTDWFDQANPTQGVDNSLPVELTSFIAEQVSDGVLLQWTTESEIENLGFVLERNGDNGFEEIANYKTDAALEGQGSTSSATDYEFTDALVVAGNTYEYRLGDVDYNGVVTYHATREATVVSNPLAAIADDFTVMAYPNPFNPSTTIRYSVMDASSIQVNIFDITGQLISTLVNQEQPAGWYEVQWNGTNQSSIEVPGGVYFSRVTVGNEVKTNKLILLK